MFKPSDYVVCPGHGVGQISAIESRDVQGEKLSYYVVNVVDNGMRVMVPTEAEINGGLRKLANDQEIKNVFDLLSDHDVEVDNSTWNRRYRDYMAKVKTGSLLEVADVLRSLLLLGLKKKLSFGEKKMVDLCKGLLVKEISISRGDDEKEVCSDIDACFG